MSSVRMCDKCGTVFSELDEGWQNYQATTTVSDDNGQPKQIQVRMDACPTCAMVPMSRRDRRVAQLERANGIGDHPDPFTLSEHVAPSTPSV